MSSVFRNNLEDNSKFNANANANANAMLCHIPALWTFLKRRIPSHLAYLPF